MQALCSQNPNDKTKPAAKLRQNVGLSTLLLLGCLTVSGCTPAYQPVWHRDSQSFFYAHRNGSVLRYDLKSKTSRQLLKPSKNQYLQVALHPHAEFIAAAAMTADEMASAAHVQVVSLTEEQETEHLFRPQGKAITQTHLLQPQCDWCPSGKRILIWAWNSGDGLSDKSRHVFAVYDVESRQITKLPAQDSVPPAVHFGGWLGVSILCPDGSGYLSQSPKGSKSEFAVISWENQTSRIFTADPVFQETVEKLYNSETPESEKNRIWYPMPQGVWQGNTLHFVTRQSQVFMNVTEATVRTEPLTQQQQQEFDRIDQADAEEEGWITTQVVPLKAGLTSLHSRGRENEFRLELVNESDNRRQVLLQENYEPFNFLAHQLFPSPDGQYVLVPLLDKTNKTGHIFILNAEGTLYDRVELGDYSDPNDPVKGSPEQK